MINKKTIKSLRVAPCKTLSLSDHDTEWPSDDWKENASQYRENSAGLLQVNQEKLAEAQGLLYADDRHSLLLIFQAMDAAGKDGAIKHVMSGVNPQGCQVFSFKQPSAEELDHNFLWRYMRCLPERGRIGIFNRSYYEDVLVVKVHPQLLEQQKLPEGKRGKSFWSERYEDINAFEHHLSRNGTIILKFFLHMSRDEQKKRFLARLSNPSKNWKFSLADVAERAFWNDYMAAYEDAIAATSTEWAPWHIIPADHKWASRILISEIITKTLGKLELEFPKPNEEQVNALTAALTQLEQE